jgi:exodeoxyribonuclease VII small subunit
MTTKKSSDNADVVTLSFEQALSELEAIVRKLESGQGDLESSIHDYTRGSALKAHCEKKLADARLRVDKIIKNAAGNLALEPLDPAGN